MSQFNILQTIDLLRCIGCAQLIFVSLLFLKNPIAPARIVAAFLISLSTYFFIGFVIPKFGWFPFGYLLLLGTFSVPFWFCILSLQLFQDDFRIRGQHWILLGFIEVSSYLLHFVLPLFVNEVIPLFYSIPQVISISLVITALFVAIKSDRNDLVESRRQFRRFFVITSAVYILLVLLNEISFRGARAPDWLELLNLLSILLLVYFFSFRMVILRPGLFFKEKTNNNFPEDDDIIEKINDAMQTHKLYREEDLSIGKLASHVGEPEYKVRRTINGKLEYRNFFDFLNQYRIAEAVLILSDENKKQIPIIRIAMDCGYASLAPFNRAFKRITGKSPSEFRSLSEKNNLT